MPDNNLTVLFFGDIVGKPGRQAIVKLMPKLKKEYEPDLVLANAENLAHGTGVTEKTLSQMIEAGIDFFTSGNHIWSKPAIYELFNDPDIPLIRPANYSDDSPGKGYKILDVGDKKILVINIHGQVFINEELSSPFKKIDEVLAECKNEKLNGIIVDFHAEATSENVAFGWHCDGRVSAVLGTHTHIPTADDRILPDGTAYQTDIGMVGLRDSVIGINKDIILNNFIEEKTQAHDIDEHGICAVNATLLKINPSTKQAISIDRIYREIEV
ncbi:MAG: TIGR00282 family metallophosphoesterase [bacterium]|nr:TIGR00282 family metallophosphoesterase [bacterium]